MDVYYRICQERTLKVYCNMEDIRRLLLLPYQTHGGYLPCIVNDLPVKIQIHKRFLKLFSPCLNSENNVLQI